jgi:hypothetical protein
VLWLPPIQWNIWPVCGVLANRRRTPIEMRALAGVWAARVDVGVIIFNRISGSCLSVS